MCVCVPSWAWMSSPAHLTVKSTDSSLSLAEWNGPSFERNYVHYVCQTEMLVRMLKTLFGLHCVEYMTLKYFPNHKKLTSHLLVLCFDYMFWFNTILTIQFWTLIVTWLAICYVPFRSEFISPDPNPSLFETFMAKIAIRIWYRQ